MGIYVLSRDPFGSGGVPSHVFPELYSIGVEPGGCIGDIEARRWKAVIVFANLSVYNHDVMLPVEEGDVLVGGDVL